MSVGPCETCLFWEDAACDPSLADLMADRAGARTRKVCIEGPVHHPTPPDHRCGRHRLREALAGGVDVRTRK